MPGGRKVNVTFENRLEWCDLLAKAYLKQDERQMAAIREGLFRVLSMGAVSFFAWYEIEKMVCGDPNIPVDALKRICTFNSPYSITHPLIVNLWQVLEEFTPAQRRQFLHFTSGSSRLSTSSDSSSRIVISKMHVTGGDSQADRYLPHASTCFYQLDIPLYSCKEVLDRKLRYAISTCDAIDADFMVGDDNYQEDDFLVDDDHDSEFF
eukprot:GFYU01008966.1.p1 GENE.GFYU01008966.1~~GFYU01008966.1.p1  ORF type:complete len:208 (+),score=43.31 GFYU01008966.1:3-626(+)